MTGNLDQALARARAFLKLQDERRRWREERAEIMAERDRLANALLGVRMSTSLAEAQAYARDAAPNPKETE